MHTTRVQKRPSGSSMTSVRSIRVTLVCPPEIAAQASRSLAVTVTYTGPCLARETSAIFGPCIYSILV